MSTTGQSEYWNGEAGRRWVDNKDHLNRAVSPFGEAAMARARPSAGERVVDVGCGGGDTTVALAAAVGPGGAVLGVDVSGPMLDEARRRVDEAGAANVRLLHTDAGAHPFEAEWDLLFSRFGVMFFEDPARAFANLHRALRPDGRLSFVCWRERTANPWMALPMGVGMPLLPPVEPTPPDAPGPFAFARPERVQGILDAAGFRQIQIDPFDAPFVLSRGGLDEAVSFSLAAGPLARMVAEAGPDAAEKVREALRVAFAPHVGSDGLMMLPAAVWLVEARR